MVNNWLYSQPIGWFIWGHDEAIVPYSRIEDLEKSLANLRVEVSDNLSSSLNNIESSISNLEDAMSQLRFDLKD